MNLKEKTIRLGDRIFARVTRNGKTILNFVTENVASMKDLVNYIKQTVQGVQGLVMIHVRNFHQGWGEERPLLLRHSVAVTAHAVIQPSLWTDAELDS